MHRSSKCHVHECTQIRYFACFDTQCYQECHYNGSYACLSFSEVLLPPLTVAQRINARIVFLTQRWLILIINIFSFSGSGLSSKSAEVKYNSHPSSSEHTYSATMGNYASTWSVRLKQWFLLPLVNIPRILINNGCIGVWLCDCVWVFCIVCYVCTIKVAWVCDVLFHPLTKTFKAKMPIVWASVKGIHHSRNAGWAWIGVRTWP